jgi:hypothetical protein
VRRVIRELTTKYVQLKAALAITAFTATNIGCTLHHALGVGIDEDSWKSAWSKKEK